MRGAAPALPPPGPPLTGGRGEQSVAVTSAELGADGRSPPATRRLALTVPHARRCRSRRSRVSERVRAQAPRPSPLGWDLVTRGSGFGMLRRPRARASLPHTQPGRSGGGRGGVGQRGPTPGGTQRRVSPGLEGESRTKGCACCHREGTEGRFATPRTPHLLVRGVGPPGRGRRPGCAGRQGLGWQGRYCPRVGDGSAPRGARRGSVFLVPICSSPFFVAFVSCPFVAVCGCGLGCDPCPWRPH